LIKRNGPEPPRLRDSQLRPMRARWSRNRDTACLSERTMTRSVDVVTRTSGSREVR
jgi:hypothetical protein